MTIYEINSLIDTFLADNIDEETGEIRNIEQLNELQIARNEKIESIALYLKNVRAMAKAVKDERQILAERQARLDRKAGSLESLLDWRCGGERFETGKVLVSYRRSASVIVDDIEGIPAEYTKIKTEVLPDKTLIKQALKEGKKVGGCHLETRNNISVK